MPLGWLLGSNGPDEELPMYDTIDELVLPLPLKLRFLNDPVSADPIITSGWLVVIWSPQSPTSTSPAGLWLLSSSSVGRRVPGTDCDAWLIETTLWSD